MTLSKGFIVVQTPYEGLMIYGLHRVLVEGLLVLTMAHTSSQDSNRTRYMATSNQDVLGLQPMPSDASSIVFQHVSLWSPTTQ